MTLAPHTEAAVVRLLLPELSMKGRPLHYSSKKGPVPFVDVPSISQHKEDGGVRLMSTSRIAVSTQIS